MEQLPGLIQQLYGIVNELEDKFPGRKFTPDGHLVGSIGEVLAAHYYGLKLLDNSAKTHDAISKGKRLVQIKITQGDKVALSSEPDYLIVMQLKKNGTAIEIYNGPGSEPWDKAGKMQKNGQRPISVSKLRVLDAGVLPKERIEK